MPQSLTKLCAHLIFSTKNRKPFLNDEIRPRVHAYLATIIRGLDSPWVVVGGVADHVHILFDMGKIHAPVEFVEQTKRESSIFVKRLAHAIRIFIGSAAMACFQLVRHIATRPRPMFETKRNTIGRKRSKRSFADFYSATGSRTMSNTYGINDCP
jgi:REP element-mobilizing transposase RayT